MKTNKSLAIYCKTKYQKLLDYSIINYNNVISLYDNVSSSIIYELPRFHYTEINNRGYDIIIDDLSLYERLANKNNRIIYYMVDGKNNNINYKTLSSFMQNIDGVIVPKNVSNELVQIVFKYTKELIHV